MAEKKKRKRAQRVRVGGAGGAGAGRMRAGGAGGGVGGVRVDGTGSEGESWWTAWLVGASAGTMMREERAEERFGRSSSWGGKVGVSGMDGWAV